MSKTTVVLTEDNPLLAQSIKEKLALSDDLELIFHASNGKILLQNLKSIAVPDVILMDIEMDEMDGITATREVKRLYPHIRILILTVFDDEQKLFEAVQAGASGYLLKDEKPIRLINAISELMEGGGALSPQMAAKALNLMRQPASFNNKREIDSSLLTIREKEVLENLKIGKTVKQIAEILFVSEKTVRKHLEHIYQKLQVNSSREILAKFE